MTAPTFRAVDQQTGEVAEAPSGTIAATIHEIEELRTQLATAEDELHDMRESRNAWADRADAAERELSRLQDQAVRIQELTTELAAARSERNTYRAAVSR